MKKGSLSVLTVAALTLALLVSACGGSKATTSTAPPTTTTNPPTTTTSQPPTTTTSPVTSTTSSGATLPTVAIAITTHNAAQMASYKGLCLMCHGPGTSNANPYPPTWNGKANGSTQNTGTYTITPGSPADHTNYTVDQCTQPGCHAAPGGTTTTTPVPTTSTPPTTSTTPTTTTPVPTSTILYGTVQVGINTDGFLPSAFKAKVGTTVVFTNNLEGQVNLTGDGFTGTNFGGMIQRAGTYTFVFTTAGVYTITADEFQCIITIIA